MAENKLDKSGLAYLWSKIVAYMHNVFPAIGDTAMGTVANTITGAIKEIVDKIGSITMGTTATTITGAIAEHEDDINALNSKLMYPTKISTMPIEPFSSVAIYFFGSTNLGSDFPQSNMYGSVIIIPSNTAGDNAVAIMLCTYPNKTYSGKFESNTWTWTALN